MTLRVFVRRGRCLGCRTCEISCALWRDSVSKRLLGASEEKPLPRPRLRVLATAGGMPFPNHCRQCEDAPCSEACPTGALAEPAGGRPGLRHELCIGCYACVMACPFVAARPDAAGRFPHLCDACAGMDHAACVDACPVQALVRCEPAEWDPAGGYDPFDARAGLWPERGGGMGKGRDCDG